VEHPTPDDGSAVLIPVGTTALEGDLVVPGGATGIVVFAHGSGSSRRSSRNRFVAAELQGAGLATLLFDLLTAEEERLDMVTREHRFDIGLLASRLIDVTDWLGRAQPSGSLKIGYFGASTGAAAALVAAARLGSDVSAVVSRGGRPDLAGPLLAEVRTPTLLIVGGRDEPVIEMNEAALAQLGGEKAMEIVPGATHLFEEEGALESVARLASDWFTRYLG
jgi:putative phosphoribosyl transferase